MSNYLPKELPVVTLTADRYKEITESTNTVVAVCTSARKGIAKKPVAEIELVVDHGIVGDAHAGKWHRQISLLNQHKVEDFKKRAIDVPIGAFGENLLVDGVDLAKLPIGSRFIFRDSKVVLEMTQIGKECHFGCAIRDQVGDCIMPREGIFAVVLQPGKLRAGDIFRIELPETVVVEGMNPIKLTHLDESGQAHMVDISDKDITSRTAIASGQIKMSSTAFAKIREHSAEKGDVLATARIAGIMAAKNTSSLIPLCHPLSLNKVTVDFDLSTDQIVHCRTLAKTTGKTGVEMEALTACSVALLTIYDMLKAVDRSMSIGEISLEEKSGGKSGTYRKS